MAKKKTARRSPAKGAAFALPPPPSPFQLQSWLMSDPGSTQELQGASGKGLIVLARAGNKAVSLRKLGVQAAPWQEELAARSKDETLAFETAAGPVWVVRPREGREGSISSGSPYSTARDSVGAAARAAARYRLADLELRFAGVKEEQELGALVGLELAAYRFRDYYPSARGPSSAGAARSVSDREAAAEAAPLPRLKIRRHDGGKLPGGTFRSAVALGRAVNLARHLVNLPPADLNTRAFAEGVERLFDGSKTVSVAVWDEARLKSERMNLLLAVGRGAEHGPRLVHLRYRPRKGGKRARKPLAFVGKGIVFDTGGVDIKPSAGMRLMKKDMGGAAAMVGVAQWLEAVDHSQPCDFYLALAENSVDGRSYRPSDIVVSRAGISVEIDNTDAEGRLVMADALDVAVSSAETPAAVIDAATLTGAGKVGLGTEIASLFANHDGLAKDLERAGWEVGDLCWRMPLFAPYRRKLSSHFADLVNSASDGMGGAITAALFLERFVGKVPWAHLDMYAWSDGQKGPLGPGGSGQSVQALARFLECFDQVKG
ncbi:MAG: leucyl aminopeptidase family protein [Bdellovibrionales bacterium]|nr:leucyl aminopeptidase family protein [Bdellovibrionales bacterium]